MRNMSVSERAVEQIRLELATRKLAIMMLGVMGVFVGIAIILTGAPTFIEAWFSPWSRIALGGLALIPGACVCIGGVIGDDRLCGWWIQVVGLLGIAAWYAVMTIAYVGLLFAAEHGIHLASLGQPLNAASSGRGYVPIIYFSLLILAVLPLCAMVRIGRPRH